MELVSGVLVVDGGATRSRAVLVDRAGMPRAAAVGPPASAGRGVRDLDLLASLRTLLARVAGATGRVAVVAGFAGAGRPAGRARARRVLAAALAGAGVEAEELVVTTDAHLALLAAAGPTGSPAAVLLAGTGSVAVAGDGERWVQVGGGGRYLDDEGSGFWLGAEALRAVVRWADGRAPEAGPLARAALAALGRTDVAALIEAAPALWRRPAEVAALAPEVLRLAALGDPVAHDIVRRGAAGLAALAAAVCRLARLPPGAGLALGGGLLRDPSPLRTMLVAALPADLGRVARPLTAPPAAGGAWSYLRAHGLVAAAERLARCLEEKPLPG